MDRLKQDFESRFYEFLESHHYASEEANRDRLRVYAPHFAPGEEVLDVGCGRGEFMELLQQQGCRPQGVDSDLAMVETCRSLGLVAHLDDAFTFLRERSRDYDAVFASNFVEHCSASQVSELFDLVHSALKPSGKFLIAVPNPESLIVQLHEFWRDATHVRLYNRQLLEFMLTYAGFSVLEGGENAVTAWQPGVGEISFSPVQPLFLDQGFEHEKAAAPGGTMPRATPERLGSRAQSPGLTPSHTAVELSDHHEPCQRRVTNQPRGLAHEATQEGFGSPQRSPGPSPSPLSGEGSAHPAQETRGVLRRLAAAVRDRVALTIADRILWRQFAGLRREVGDVRGGLGELGEDVGDLRGRLGELNEDVVNLRGGLGELREDGIALRHGLETLANQILVLQTGLVQLNENLNRVADNQTAATGTLQALRSNFMFLFPAREIYLLCKRGED